MKKLALVLVVLIGAFQIQAQDENPQELEVSLLIGPGYINNTMGMTWQNEVMYSFHEDFGVGLNLTYTNIYEGLKNETRNYNDFADAGGYQEISDKSLYSVGINGYYMPLKYSDHRIILGTGFSFNFQSNTRGYIDGADDANTMQIGNNRLSDIGLNLAVKYTYSITDRFVIGINGYGMFFDNSSESVTLSLGYRIIEEEE